MARSNKLPEFVKEKRRQAQLTQIDLAEKAGVGLRFIRELEQGKLSLRMDKVNQVLRLFGQQLGPIPIDREIFTNEES
jgi:y4mF family transcriptional regulator